MEITTEADYQIFLDSIMNLLDENEEWRVRYAIYANDIEGQAEKLTGLSQAFREGKNISVYTTVSATKSGSNKLNLRYKGQSIGDLVLRKNGNRELLINVKTAQTNLRDFGFGDGQELNCDWVSPVGTTFRKYFQQDIPRSNSSGKGNVEHHIENLLLREFHNGQSANKKLVGIQPVKLSDCFFQFPTPLSASGKTVKYSERYGGGIDILCRQGHGRGTKLLVVEVKDENKRSEPPEVAIKQAIAYAGFLVRLLRSGSGPQWWRLFGFTGSLPKKLTIKVAAAMPDNGQIPDFINKIVSIGEDKIEMHYMPFTMDSYGITKIDLL